jgi:hypothetical protein
MLEIKGKKATRYEQIFGKNPEWADHLITFGESGTFKTKTDTIPKIHDKGVQCMFVGNAENHKGGVYRMWNPQTRKEHVTRDVIILKLMLFQTTVEEISIVHTLTQDETIDAGESDVTAEKAVEIESSGGDDSDERSNSSLDGESDEEYEMLDGTTEPTGDSEWHTTKRSGRIRRLPSRYRT